MTKIAYARFVLTLVFAAPGMADSLRAAESVAEPSASPDSDWPMFKHDLKRTGFASSPALDRGKVFAATGNQSGSGRLYCFDEASGTILWEFDIDDITFSSPVIEGDRVFIANSGDRIGGNRRYRLYCLAVNGTLDGSDAGVADDHQGNSDLIWSHDTTDYARGCEWIVRHRYSLDAGAGSASLVRL